MPMIEITGMGCEGCADIVENAVGEVHGVTEVDADHESGTVEYDGDADREAIRESVEFAGYTIVGDTTPDATES